MWRCPTQAGCGKSVKLTAGQGAEGRGAERGQPREPEVAVQCSCGHSFCWACGEVGAQGACCRLLAAGH
jgi:hypothetical protein